MSPSSRPFARVIALLALCVVAAGGAVGSAWAAAKFNIGDRVEVDDLGNGGWRPGLVIAENDRTYLVSMDPRSPGESSPNFTVP